MIIYYFYTVSAILCNVSAQLCLKRASHDRLFVNGMNFAAVSKIFTNQFVWAGAILYALSFVLTVRIYEVFDLSLISPIMMSLIFLLILFWSYFLFGEHISALRIGGAVLILLGIWIICIS